MNLGGIAYVANDVERNILMTRDIWKSVMRFCEKKILLRKLQAQTLPDATSPIGKIRLCGDVMIGELINY